MNQPKQHELSYLIYPSLLNQYQRVLDAENDAEDFSNIDSESGDYRRSPEEILAEREQELLDSINRVERLPIEAADKGTAFNEIVDCLITGMRSTRDDVTISKVQVDDKEMVKAAINGFEFVFDTDLCKATAEYFAGTVPQHRCEGIVETKYGSAMLYGYADYIFPNKVVDLKTCSRYDFGKYSRNWQKEVYPYCLIQSGDLQECNMFEFYVVQLKNPTKEFPWIRGVDYKEEYNYNHEKASIDIRQMLERFIEWLEAHKDQITDEKIFNYRWHPK